VGEPLNTLRYAIQMCNELIVLANISSRVSASRVGGQGVCCEPVYERAHNEPLCA